MFVGGGGVLRFIKYAGLLDMRFICVSGQKPRARPWRVGGARTHPIDRRKRV